MRISKSEIDSFPRFSKADAGYFVVDSLCFFTGKGIDNLCTFLNSSLATYYYLKNIAILDNGGMQMRQQYIEEIPCPPIESIEDDDSIYNLFGFNIPIPDISDMPLATLYGLSESESRYIDNLP